MIIKNRLIFTIPLVMMLSGCVTQNYENNNETPMVENESSNDDIALTRISLAMGYLKMGNTTQAKLNLEKAKRFSPNLTQVYTAFAHYYESVDEPELAISAFEKALSLDSLDADTLNNYGVFLCRQERYIASEEQFLKAIAVPSYVLTSKSYENLALCQLKANSFEKAELYLEKSIAHNPSRSSSLLQMMRLQYAIGQYEKAQEYLRKYERSTRRFVPEAYALAYKIYEKQGNKTVANNYGRTLVSMFPTSYESKQYLLNRLAFIEADELAKQYNLLHKKSKKKRIVLSPNKTGVKSKKKSMVLTADGAMEKSKVTQEPPKTVNIEKTPVVKSSVSAVTDTQGSVEVNTPVVAEQTKEKTKSVAIHIVEKGDSLWSISEQYNIELSLLKRWNGFRKKQVIFTGDVIYLADPKKQ